MVSRESRPGLFTASAKRGPIKKTEDAMNHGVLGPGNPKFRLLASFHGPSFQV